MTMEKTITKRGLIGYIKNHDIKMCKKEIDFDGQYMGEMIVTGNIALAITFIIGILIVAYGD